MLAKRGLRSGRSAALARRLRCSHRRAHATTLAHRQRRSTRRRWIRMRSRCSTTRGSRRRSTSRWSTATSSSGSSRRSRCRGRRSTRRPGASSCARASTFHDGTPFTVDDAVFSIERALTPPSQRVVPAEGRDRREEGRRADDRDPARGAGRGAAREVHRPADDEQGLVAGEHGVELPQDFNAKQETYAVRNANGTGPYRLERYEPDIRTVLKRNPRWWGWSDKRSGNVDEVDLADDPLRCDAAGRAGLGRGRPGARPAVPGRRAAEDATGTLTVMQRPRPRQAVPRLRPGARRARGRPTSRARNPFKDLRVRRAVYHADQRRR